MGYLIGKDANLWATEEAHLRAGADEFGVAVFVQRTLVEDQQHRQATHPVWFVLVTLGTGDGARIHCEPAGVGEPDETLVRQAVANGIVKLSMMDSQGDVPGTRQVTTAAPDIWGTVRDAGHSGVPVVTSAVATGPSPA